MYQLDLEGKRVYTLTVRKTVDEMDFTAERYISFNTFDL